MKISLSSNASPLRSSLKLFMIAGLVSVLFWANWQPPALHSFVPSVEFVTFQTEASPAQGTQLQTLAAALPGVTAAAFNPRSGCLTVARRPDQLPLTRLCGQLAHLNGYSIRVLPPATLSPAVAARQCPVPTGYVLALEQLRFALSVRRFFVST